MTMSMNRFLIFLSMVPLYVSCSANTEYADSDSVDTKRFKIESDYCGPSEYIRDDLQRLMNRALEYDRWILIHRQIQAYTISEDSFLILEEKGAMVRYAIGWSGDFEPPLVVHRHEYSSNNFDELWAVAKDAIEETSQLETMVDRGSMCNIAVLGSHAEILHKQTFNEGHGLVENVVLPLKEFSEILEKMD